MAEFKPDTPEDFDKFVAAADSTEGWTIAFEDAQTKVWTQKSENSPINIVRLYTVLPATNPDILYDVLHDPDYRKGWDENMVEGYNIQQIDANNDVGYYSAKGVLLISGRDFVNQRAWRVREIKEGVKEYVIKNHSVIHPSAPEKKGFVRAWSYMTGYMIRTRPEGGCVLTYLTQTDPKGSLPTMVVNYFTKTFAPKIVSKVENAAKGYVEWKSAHNPEDKPWLTGKYPALMNKENKS